MFNIQFKRLLLLLDSQSIEYMRLKFRMININSKCKEYIISLYLWIHVYIMQYVIFYIKL